MSAAEASAGRPAGCPSWCVTDHGRYAWHGSQSVLLDPAFGVQAVDADVPEGPSVTIWTPGTSQLWAPVGHAGNLAALVDALAEATPEQHAALAAEIRRAVALIGDAE